MFKSTLIVLSILLFGHVQDNPDLSNTKWEGIMNIPNPSNVVLAFGNNGHVDILLSGNSIETTTYKLKNDTLALTKLTGESPCGGETGYYKYAVKDSILTISLISDDCNMRSIAFSPEGYHRIKDR